MLTPTQIKTLCQRLGLAPSKQYGQHYLITDAPIRKMIEAADLTPHDVVVEVGPGFGVLTLSIAPLVKQVVAFEIEKKLQPYWEEQSSMYPNIQIIWGNFLRTSEGSLSGVDAKNQELLTEMSAPYKVLANLPYQITSQAIRTFLEAQKKPERVIIMVQKEVAERMCAKPGDMSLLAVSVQYYGTPRTITNVSRGCFWPVPKVDSAVVAITNIRERQDSERFFSIVRAAFANKRKQAWKNISTTLALREDVVRKAFLDVVHDDKVRAEALSVDEWLQVIEKLPS